MLTVVDARVSGASRYGQVPVSQRERYAPGIGA